MVSLKEMKGAVVGEIVRVVVTASQQDRVLAVASVRLCMSGGSGQSGRRISPNVASAMLAICAKGCSFACSTCYCHEMI